VCCQVEVSATSWSLVQRSPTDCGVSISVIVKRRKWRGLGPRKSCRAIEKKNVSHYALQNVPGTLLANSTTLWTLGVTRDANCCHNHTRCCSSDSAVEDATSGPSGLEPPAAIGCKGNIILEPLTECLWLVPANVLVDYYLCLAEIR
jgi:hypothetical protein